MELRVLALGSVPLPTAFSLEGCSTPSGSPAARGTGTARGRCAVQGFTTSRRCRLATLCEAAPGLSLPWEQPPPSPGAGTTGRHQHTWEAHVSGGMGASFWGDSDVSAVYGSLPPDGGMAFQAWCPGLPRSLKGWRCVGILPGMCSLGSFISPACP